MRGMNGIDGMIECADLILISIRLQFEIKFTKVHLKWILTVQFDCWFYSVEE